MSNFIGTEKYIAFLKKRTYYFFEKSVDRDSFAEISLETSLLAVLSSKN